MIRMYCGDEQVLIISNKNSYANNAIPIWSIFMCTLEAQILSSSQDA